MFIYTGQDNPKIPSLRKVDEEVTSLLRMVSMPMVGGYQDISLMLQKPWPAYIDPEPELLWRPVDRSTRQPQPQLQPQPTAQGRTDLRQLPGKYSVLNGPHKYSSPALVNTPLHLKTHHLNLLNAGKSYNTWKGESNTGRHVQKIEQTHGICLDFPWDLGKASNYVVASSQDGLTASTIRVYLARVRSLHSRYGSVPEFESRQLSVLLKGAAQLEQQRNSKQRLCVSPELMRVAKDTIELSRKSEQWKALMWLLFTWFWIGAFRSDDILQDSPSAFSPETSLLKRNVSSRTDSLGGGKTITYLKVFVPSPKQRKGNGGVYTELLPTSNWFCPVSAYRRYCEANEDWGSDLPLIHLNGVLYTKKDFNRDLRVIFGGKIGPNEQLTSHSFRSGVISALARAGATEEVMKSQTDHSSSAFRAYLKLGRSARLSQQMSVITLLEDLAGKDFGANNMIVE